MEFTILASKQIVSFILPSCFASLISTSNAMIIILLTIFLHNNSYILISTTQHRNTASSKHNKAFLIPIENNLTPFQLFTPSAFRVLARIYVKGLMAFEEQCRPSKYRILKRFLGEVSLAEQGLPQIILCLSINYLKSIIFFRTVSRFSTENSSTLNCHLIFVQILGDTSGVPTNFSFLKALAKVKPEQAASISSPKDLPKYPMKIFLLLLCELAC